MNQLEATGDSFGGVTIRQECLPTSAEQFATLLDSSLIVWGKQGIKLVWLTIPIEKTTFVPIAVAAGFFFHHCSEDQITLVNRLVDNAFIPTAATHFIGAGAVVLSEGNELLVVLERHESRPGFYKLPGGLLNPDEHIAEAVVREVFEETAVQTQFESLLCLGHLHRWQYGKSNVYFVCRLLPLTYEITVDETEIAQAVWMPLEEYLGSPSVGAFNKRIVEATLNTDGLKLSTIEGLEVDRSQFEVYLPSFKQLRSSR
ncbi:MAG: NUDIX domain-containing protein [Chloroflexi bacterium]|nr:NUDIX domain-containing protein [Chloroflexota bacterium]MCI0732097.1 NUDIX domain-containing protein [Chloroflexota bacterium]